MQIRKWNLACGCVVDGLKGFETCATREGSRLGMIRVRCQNKHELLTSNIRWVSTEGTYDVIRYYLAEVIKDASITTLDFNCEEVGYEVAKAIATVLTNPGCELTTLNLRNNGISDKVAIEITASLTNINCKLTSLNLGINQIGIEGAEKIAAALKDENCKLSALDLSSNRIGNRGAEAIAAALKSAKCRLTKLDLSNNDISEGLLKSICRLLEEKNAIAKMEMRRSKDIIELLRSNLEKYDASMSGFKVSFEENKAAIDIDKQQELQKEEDIINKLSESLNKVEDEFKLASKNVSEQLENKAAEAREFRRALDARGKEIKRHIAEEKEKVKRRIAEKKEKEKKKDEKKRSLLAEKANEQLGKYTKHKDYAKVHDAYMRLALSFANLIELSYGSVDDNGAAIIALGLKLSTKITMLYLYDNLIGPEGAKALGEALKGHPSLQRLMLGGCVSGSGNPIGDEGAKGIAEGLKSNKVLRLLNVGSCRITKVGVAALADATMRGATALRTVWIHSNKLTYITQHNYGFRSDIDVVCE